VKKHQAFLITQMPLPHTIVDFWKLVLEQNATKIVMLNESLDKVSIDCFFFRFVTC